MPQLASASGIAKAVICPASHILPPSREAKDNKYKTKGTGVHGLLKSVLNSPDREAARLAYVARMDPADPARRVCEGIDLDELPRGGVEELAIAYNPTTDTAREVGRDIERAYEAAGADRSEEIVMSIDVTGVVDGVALIVDWKTGVRAGAARKSWQMRVCALGAARLFGVDRARAIHYHIDDDGEVKKGLPLDLDDFDLAGISGELQRYKETHQRQLAEYLATRALPTNHGEHCLKPFPCDAYDNCPSKASLLRASLVAENGPGVDGIEAFEAMDPRELGAKVKLALDMQAVLERFLAQAEDFARLETRGLPIVGESGEEVAYFLELEGRYHDEITSAEKVESYLTDAYGKEVAAAAVSREPKTTKGKIEEAVKAYARPRKLKLKDETEKAIAGLRDCGAIGRGQYEPKVKLISREELTKKFPARAKALTAGE